MKISVTTSAVLLCSAAVQALLRDDTTVGAPDDVAATIDDITNSADDPVSDILDGVADIIRGIFGGGDDKDDGPGPDRIEELKKVLAERRELVVKRLEFAEKVHVQKVSQAGIMRDKYSNTIEEINSIQAEITELVYRKVMADAKLLAAVQHSNATKLEVDEAEEALDAIVKEARELRDAIAWIDEQTAIIGLPEEDWPQVNPSPPRPFDPEEPEFKSIRKHD
jgi:hypothetical protein